MKYAKQVRALRQWAREAAAAGKPAVARAYREEIAKLRTIRGMKPRRPE